MSPTKICQFTSKGIQLFESAIKSYGEDKDLSKLEASFKDLPNEITEISDSPDFDNGLEFANRYELSKYLFDKLGGFIEDNQLVNEALNSTLSRTINTSLSTFVVLLTIFVFGGDNIKGFVFALMVGVLVGTYSSIFIATPSVLDFSKKLKG